MPITPCYGNALAWADELHRDQRRKGKAVPYISHLIAVSGLVWEDGGTEDQAIAGLKPLWREHLEPHPAADGGVDVVRFLQSMEQRN